MNNIINTYVKYLLFIILVLLSNITIASTKELKIKTAYIYNFIKFTKFNNNSNSINLCVNNANTNEISILKSIDNQKVKNKIIKIINNNSDRCDLMYVFSMGYTNNRPNTIIIADNYSLIKNGADISFRLNNDKLKLVLNKSLRKNKNIKINSRLMNVVEEY